MQQEKIADIISQLKQVRDEEGLSYQRIADLVEENGAHVSVSTVKRVFEEGSESYGWQYENTLKPIAAAVLGLYSPAVPATAAEADGLKAVIKYKSEKIADLEARLLRCEESYQRRLDFIKGQISLKDARIDRLHGIIERMIDALLPEVKGGGGALNVRTAESGSLAGLDLPEEVEN